MENMLKDAETVKKKIRHRCVLTLCKYMPTTEKISYFSIPSSVSPTTSSVSEKWIATIRKDRQDNSWTAKKHDVVCSLHFTEDDFIITTTNTRKKKQHAVPHLHIRNALPLEVRIIKKYTNNNPNVEPGQKKLGEGPKTAAKPAKGKPSFLQVPLAVSTANYFDLPENCFGIVGLIYLYLNDIYHTPVCQSTLVADISLDDDVADLIRVRRKQHFTRKARKRKREETECESRTKPTQLQTANVSSPSKLRVVALADHNYRLTSSPISNTKSLLTRIAVLEKTNRNLLNKFRRRKEAEKKLEVEIQKCKLTNNTIIADTIQRFKPSLRTIMETEKSSLKVKSKSGMRYSNEMKQIAVSLHYYSPKAYRYISENIFTLPHEKTLSEWMKGCNSNPGFNTDVLARLQSAFQNGEINCRDVNFIIDEMAIRKETVWSTAQNKFVGHIDYGIEMPEGDLPLASNVLVGLLVGFTGGWKVPIGFIFTDHLHSDGLHQFTLLTYLNAIKLITSHGFTLHSIIADGCASNVKMFEKFGIREDFKTNNIVHFFTNPHDAVQPQISAVYDVCHLMKLIRNLFCDYEFLYDENGQEISYNYIKLLFSLQDTECIRAANKLRKDHIDWQSHKMKVKLAVQLLSASVADAISFLREDLHLPQFSGSKPTTDFLKMVDATFDILNSRCPGKFGTKAPLDLNNIVEKNQFLLNSSSKLLQYKIQTPRGRVMYLKDSRRKRAVVGLHISILSIIFVSYNILSRSVAPLKYIITYRFSQDLLELLFSKFRNRLGSNNNPNVIEMQTIIKHCWHTSLLRPKNGNCLALDNDAVVYNGFLPLKRKPREDENDVLLNIRDFTDSALIDFPSEFYNNCLGYIAGNVVYKISKHLKCSKCKEFLFDSAADPVPIADMMLTQRKNRGGLHIPSGSVIKIIKLTDKFFRMSIVGFKSVPTTKYLDAIIIYYVLRESQGINLFPEMGDHAIDFDFLMEESHSTQLIRMIARQFLRIRLFDLGKRLRKDVQSPSLRISSNHKIKYRHE